MTTTTFCLTDHIYVVTSLQWSESQYILIITYYNYEACNKSNLHFPALAMDTPAGPFFPWIWFSSDCKYMYFTPPTVTPFIWNVVELLKPPSSVLISSALIYNQHCICQTEWQQKYLTINSTQMSKDVSKCSHCSSWGASLRQTRLTHVRHVTPSLQLVQEEPRHAWANMYSRHASFLEVVKLKMVDQLFVQRKLVFQDCFFSS